MAVSVDVVWCVIGVAQRKMKMKQLEGLETETAALLATYGHLFEEERSVCINLPTPSGSFGSDQQLITIENVSFGHPVQPADSDSGSGSGSAPVILFKNVEFSIYPNSRIVLLGKNGSGKTSFLNLLIEEGSMVPITGAVKRYPGCKITMLQQHHYKGDQLDPALNANDHIRLLQIQANQAHMQAQLLMDPNAVSASIADPNSAISQLLHNMTRLEESQIRNYLANFGIVNNTPVIPVRNLSGGQKMKLALAVALYDKPDVIILDEVRRSVAHCCHQCDK